MLFCANPQRACGSDAVLRKPAESMRQETGAALFQDLELFGAGWSFDVRALPPDMRAATHVWQVGALLRS